MASASALWAFSCVRNSATELSTAQRTCDNKPAMPYGLDYYRLVQCIRAADHDSIGTFTVCVVLVHQTPMTCYHTPRRQPSSERTAGPVAGRPAEQHRQRRPLPSQTYSAGSPLSDA